MLWLPRALALSLVCGTAAAFVSHLRPWLVTEQIALVTAGLAALSVITMILLIWLKPRPLLTSARRFDLRFGLKERVSTALELLAGDIQANEELKRLQIDDALRIAADVRPREQIPIRARRRDWTAVVALLGVLALLLIVPNPQAAAVEAGNAQNAAIADAADTLRDITRDIATDPNLNAGDRQNLLQALQSAVDILDQPDIRPEEALAAISNAESLMRQTGERLREQNSATASSLESTAELLRSLESLTTTPQDDGRSLNELLEALQRQAAGLDAAQRQAAANALAQSAQGLQAASPGAAQALRQAAEALREGDTQSAQANLETAQAALEEASRQAEQSQSAAQNLQRSAQQAQQAGQQVSQPPQSAQQNSVQPAQSPQQASSNSAQPANEAQPSGQSQAAQSGQPGASEQAEAGAQNSQPGDETGVQQTQGGQGAPMTGQQSEGQSSQGSAPGSGDQAGAAGQDQPNTAGVGQTQQSEADNNPDGAGESAFEPIYAPRRLGGESGDATIQLEPDTSDMPVAEGDFAENPAGQVTVPYNEVFTDYAAAANRALGTDYIPLGLRDVVRDYFSSLEPGQRPR
jgi:hypothetical protein